MTKQNLLCSILLFMIYALAGYAQRERNYIYLFDCTQSMDGYNGSPRIWEQTKQWLWDDIEQLRDGQVTLIPFQGESYEPIAFDRSAYKRAKLEKPLDEYIQKVTNTNICAAWDAGVKLLDEHKDNYLYVLTDGLDNVQGTAALCQRIRSWCNQNKNSYVFYVMLTQYAKDPGLMDAINSCSTVFLIDGDGKHLPPFGAFTSNEITVNTRDFSPQTLSFSAAGTYQAQVENADELFQVGISDISQGHATFTVTPRDAGQLHEALEGQDVYSFDVKVKGQELQILNDVIHVHVINKPERVLQMKGEEVNLGHASHYRQFLFKAASAPDTLEADLGAVFNGEALANHSSARMQLTSESLGNGDYTLLLNGTEMTDKTFTLDETTGEARLGLVLHPDAPTGKHYFSLMPQKTHELDRINNLEPQDFTLSLRARYSRSMNPLLFACILLAIALVTLLVFWLLVIKPVRYVSFKAVRLMLTGEPSYYQNYRIKGAREIRFISGRPRRQNVLNRLFTGEILYKPNPFEGAPDWSVKPRNGRGSKGAYITARDFDIEPSPLVTTRDEGPATVSWQGRKIEVKIM